MLPCAVGTADATNPICLVIPCHRVVRAGGALGGYGFGVDRKRWLLAHESRPGGLFDETASRATEPHRIIAVGLRTELIGQ